MHVVGGTGVDESDHRVGAHALGAVRGLHEEVRQASRRVKPSFKISFRRTFFFLPDRELELVDEPGEEEEELVLGQRLPDAEALAHHEGDASLVAAEAPGRRVHEAGRAEAGRVLPVVGVVHHLGRQQGSKHVFFYTRNRVMCNRQSDADYFVVYAKSRHDQHFIALKEHRPSNYLSNQFLMA